MLTLVRFLLVFLSIFPPVLIAQSTQQEFESRLLHKPLYLRGLWKGERLHFDAAGHIIGDQSKSSFTLCGVDIRKIKLGSNNLVLEGRRVGLEFQDDKAKRVALESGDSIKIEIDGASDFVPALNAIFAESLAELAPTLPFYWQPYAHAHLLPADLSSPSQMVDTAAKDPVFTVGGAVSAPKIIRSAEPMFSDAARQLHYGGKSLISVTLNEQGKVEKMHILRASGLGLDEQAMAAILGYEFEPAKKNGHPVRIEINMDVNFEIR